MATPPAAPASSGGDPFVQLTGQLEEARKQHRRAVDGFLYNGGTFVVLLFTGAAAFLPTVTGDHHRWIPQALAALAALVVATERSLNFGSRWRFHIEMWNAYSALIDMIAFYRASTGLPDSERQKYLGDLWKELYSVRRREAGIPGAGTGGQS
jgi:hypothetical protein